MDGKKSTVRSRRLNAMQLTYLESFIWRSENADDFTKQCVIWLIRQSRGLTREVKMFLQLEDGGQKVAHGVHGMNSLSCTTHLGELCRLAGSVRLAPHSGSSNAGAVISVVDYRKNGTNSQEAKQLKPDFDEIRAIKIHKF